MSEIDDSLQQDQIPPELLNRPYQIYLVVISLAGVCLAILGFAQITAQQYATFMLLALLAAAVQTTATLTLKGVDFSVSSAVSLAAIPSLARRRQRSLLLWLN